MREVSLNGVTLTVRDDRVNWSQFWDLYESGGWEPQTTALLEEVITPAAWFVDFGAWIGPHTLWAAAHGAKVLAIEPDPVAREGLIDNLAANGFTDLVRVVNGAIDTQTGEAHLGHAPVGEFGDSRSRLSPAGPVAVQTWTLPDLLREQDIDPADVALVKMDVEGYETTLCPDLAPWLARHSIPALIELHGGYPEPEWFEGYEIVRYPAGPLIVR
jgi:FkbM family methyltransferase